MKRVVLLGDSIRLGYEGVVRAELADVAFVWGPAENGQHTVNLLLNFWNWVAAQQPDVLHLNAGLWDMRRVAWGETDTVVPLPRYRENVARLLALARRHTCARLIWATCTPNNQAPLDRTHRRAGLAGRSAADIEPYNRAAVEVAQAEGVLVNDLHRLVVQAGPANLLDADGVHFTPAGYETLGKAVAQIVRSQLQAPKESPHVG